MGGRGPEPESHKQTKALTIPGLSEKRPSPPSGMGKVARRTWKHIVGSLPSSHFRPGDHPLLRAYCEASALHQEATEAIRKDGAVVEIFKIEVDDQGNEQKILKAIKANPWVSIQTQSACTMSQLSTKLRIAVNSRISNAKAAFEKSEEPAKNPRRGLMFGGK